MQCNFSSCCCDRLSDLGLCFLLITSFCWIAQAQDPLPSDPPSIVNTSIDPFAQLITAQLSKLKDGTPDEKATAEKTLVETGPRALAYLPRLPSSIGGEFRDAMNRIRDKIQAQAIGQYAQPSRINLSGKLSAADIFLELIDQSDNDLQLKELPGTSLEVNFADVSFWEALDQVLDDLQLDVGPQSGNGSLQIIPTKGPAVRSIGTAYSGVFRFEPLRLDATRTVLPSHLSSLSLSLDVSWEPRLKPVYFHFPMSSLLAECDNGEILTAASPEAKPEYSPSESCSLEASIMMNLPSRDAKKILRLSGSMTASIPGAPVTIEFDKLENEETKEQKVGNLRVQVEQVKKMEEIYAIKIKAGLTNAGQTMDSFRGWLMANDAYILNAKGDRIANAGSELYEMTSESFGRTYYFELGEKLEGSRLIFEAPGAVTEQHVEFILKDLPLP
jgi:hypothetical protein